MIKADQLDLAAPDRTALDLALKQCRAASSARDQQITAMLMERPWQEVAQFCSYNSQMDSLKLKPWEFPPCWVEPDDRQHRQAAKLLREMLAAGVSCWHPDPLAALDQKRAGAVLGPREDRTRL
jgi:hypothetical protein